MNLKVKRLIKITSASVLTALMLIFASVTAASIPEEITIEAQSDIQIADIKYITIESSPGVSSADSECFDAKARLFGFVPIKEVSVSVTERPKLAVGGFPVGITVNSEGVLVFSVNDVDTKEGAVNPGKLCGLKSGDTILSINGEKIITTGDLTSKISQSEGKTLTLTVRRQDNSVEELLLTPVYSKTDNCYRAGIWIRDSAAGIGSLTFIRPEDGTFGGLGHAICDGDSGTVLVAEGGCLNDAVITGIREGCKGVPGEVLGYLGENRLGKIEKNTSCGVFGSYIADFSSLEVYEIAFKQEIKEGEAQVLTTLPGEDSPRLFSIKIERVDFNSETPTKNMVIKITDEELIEKTGGIVQGMSGSPILQNGRIVGAVTHVFVNDPTKGYGIFIENMLNAA